MEKLCGNHRQFWMFRRSMQIKSNWNLRIVFGKWHIYIQEHPCVQVQEHTHTHTHIYEFYFAILKIKRPSLRQTKIGSLCQVTVSVQLGIFGHLHSKWGPLIFKELQSWSYKQSCWNQTARLFIPFFFSSALVFIFHFFTNIGITHTLLQYDTRGGNQL